MLFTLFWHSDDDGMFWPAAKHVRREETRKKLFGVAKMRSTPQALRGVLGA
jgi:hypothetical protein